MPALLLRSEGKSCFLVKLHAEFHEYEFCGEKHGGRSAFAKAGKCLVMSKYWIRSMLFEKMLTFSITSSPAARPQASSFPDPLTVTEATRILSDLKASTLVPLNHQAAILFSKSKFSSA